MQVANDLIHLTFVLKRSTHISVRGGNEFACWLLDHLRGFLRRIQRLKAHICVLKAPQSLFGSLKGLAGEIHHTAVMGLKDEISDHHRRESLGQKGMVSGEELLKGYEIAIRFAHLLAVDGNHIVVHPAFHGLMPLGRHALRYLAFMVGEHEIHAAAVDIECIAEIFPAHGDRKSVV